jgi:hypothetical protein
MSLRDIIARALREDRTPSTDIRPSYQAADTMLAALAAHYRTAAQAIEDSGGMNDDPLTDAIWSGCPQADRQGPVTVEAPDTVAALAVAQTFATCALVNAVQELTDEVRKLRESC